MTNPDEDLFQFVPASSEHMAIEKKRARSLRLSQWWKNTLGKGACHYCKTNFPPKQLSMDHIIPIVRGGRSIKKNVVPCCKDCNAKKGYLLPSEWNEYLKRIRGSK